MISTTKEDSVSKNGRTADDDWRYAEKALEWHGWGSPVGLGIHPDYGAAVTAMTRVGARFEPDATSRKTYDQLYREVYAPLYPRLRPLYRRIREITGYPA